MKKVLIYTLAILASLIVILFGVAACQPTEWKVERSVLINAPREKVWQIVSDLNRYNEWNPYARMDPEAKITVTGPAATLGSTYAWDGTNTGAGQMTTTWIEAGERIDFDLQFLRPMSVTNKASFIVGTQENPTKMTWVMNGTHQGFTGLISRVLHLFMNMDALVGESFESGLSVLRDIAEKAEN